MTLPYRYIILNSSPGDLRPRTLPLGHGVTPQYSFLTSEWGRNNLFLQNSNAEQGSSPTFQAGSSFNHCRYLLCMMIFLSSCPFHISAGVLGLKHADLEKNAYLARALCAHHLTSAAPVTHILNTPGCLDGVSLNRLRTLHEIRELLWCPHLKVIVIQILHSKKKL